MLGISAGKHKAVAMRLVPNLPLVEIPRPLLQVGDEETAAGGVGRGGGVNVRRPWDGGGGSVADRRHGQQRRRCSSSHRRPSSREWTRDERFTSVFLCVCVCVAVFVYVYVSVSVFVCNNALVNFCISIIHY